MPWKRPTHDQRKKQATPMMPKPVRKSTKIYGRAWRKARSAYLMKHPLCVMCLKEGRHELATDLDHIIPHRGDMQIFWDSDNWQSLCKPCHSSKTAKEDGAFGNKIREES